MSASKTSRILLAIVGCCFVALSVSYQAVAQSSGITAPATGTPVNGIVTIEGTATDPSFLRYELAFLAEANTGAGWIAFAEGSQPVTNGVLAIWDTTVGRSVGAPVFPDGSYRLRLRVVRQDYNYDEFFVNGITVANSGPTPTPTGAATRPPAVAQPTVGSADATPFQQPAIPPTLTPFPTPTPRATRESTVGPLETGTDDSGTDEGLLAQLNAIDFGRFGDAFVSGMKLALLLFAILAAYLLLRGALRWAWRLLIANR